jgi:iron complex transport system ATP-binding protein
MTALDASRLCIRRGRRVILDQVSIHAEAGDFIAVIGANGAGKSTLLSVLAGLQRPDTGNVTMDGIPIHELSGMKLANRRAYLPQNPRCEWPIAVERLVALGLTPSPRGMRPARAARSAGDDFVGRRARPCDAGSGPGWGSQCFDCR